LICRGVVFMKECTVVGCAQQLGYNSMMTVLINYVQLQNMRFDNPNQRADKTRHRHTNTRSRGTYRACQFLVFCVLYPIKSLLEPIKLAWTNANYSYQYCRICLDEWKLFFLLATGTFRLSGRMRSILPSCWLPPWSLYRML
jgi:hypothetical protein